MSLITPPARDETTPDARRDTGHPAPSAIASSGAGPDATSEPGTPARPASQAAAPSKPAPEPEAAAPPTAEQAAPRPAAAPPAAAPPAAAPPAAAPPAATDAEEPTSRPASGAENAENAEGAGEDATEAAEAGGAEKAPSRARRIRSHVATVGAVLLVVVALTFPNRIPLLTPGAFLRIPVEALAGVGLILILQPRVRPFLAVVAGVGLGLFSIMKIVDMGFYEVLSRPFDLVLDWTLLPDAAGFVHESAGRPAEIGAIAGVVLLVAGILAVMAMATLRVTRLVGRHPVAAGRSAAVAAVAWIALAVLGVQIVPELPVASHSATGLVRYRAYQVETALQDQEAFAAAAAKDAFRGVAPQNLLTGLRGKDVMLVFVESYGRSAVQDPRIAPGVDGVLDAGTARLRAAGFAARSGFLTSPTAGGGSWLAQSTFLSGLWISNQQRFRSLTTSDRLTLTGAFRKADWETVGVAPGVTRAWPEGRFYGLDRVWDSRNLGYSGPKFGWSAMPDQFTMAAYQRLENGRPHLPTMAQIALTTSHIPWTPLPRMADWDQLGDGSLYAPMAAAGQSRTEVWKKASSVRAHYATSIEYSLTTLIEYLERYGKDNTVMVFLGDHQPVSTVTGQNTSRDVPITIVAKDPAVLNRVSDWRWDEGLNPGPKAPVWPMDEFRDKFLTAFGPRLVSPTTPATH